MFPQSETDKLSGVLPATAPASACRSGSHNLGKFVRGSNLALVFEAVQSRPMATFPESWHDYPEQYFGSQFAQCICLPGSPKWRYRKNYDVNKWQVWIREAFLGLEYRHPLGPWLDDIVGKTCQIYNSLPPCKETDISFHKLCQNGHFVSSLSSSVAAILKRRFRDPGLDLKLCPTVQDR